jgi:hypothetical protein
MFNAISILFIILIVGLTASYRGRSVLLNLIFTVIYLFQFETASCHFQSFFTLVTYPFLVLIIFCAINSFFIALAMKELFFSLTFIAFIPLLFSYYIQSLAIKLAYSINPY